MPLHEIDLNVQIKLNIRSDMEFEKLIWFLQTSYCLKTLDLIQIESSLFLKGAIEDPIEVIIEGCDEGTI